MSDPHDRVVITGTGVIASVGAGSDEFEEALYAGRTGLTRSEVIDLDDGTPVETCELLNFRPQKWLGPKGIRVLDRSARFLAVAGQMVLESVDKVPEPDSEGDPELGLVCGTIFGSVHSITSFDWSGLEDGPKYVNPMAFPNTVINSPAGQAAIKHKLRGVNSTISAGLASSLYAMRYAADFLRFGRASMLLTGGVEEVAEESYLGFRKNDWLSPANRALPFSARRDGVVLGEGAALVAMETLASAERRNTVPLAEFGGFGSAHDARSIQNYSPDHVGAVEAINQALGDAEMKDTDISFIISGASGSRGGDRLELEALREVFGARLAEIPVYSPKAACGETLGAAGALGVVAALLAFKRGQIPPTPAVEEVPADLRLSKEAQPCPGQTALITGFSCDGNNAALILKQF